METIYTWLKNIVIFMIFLTILSNLLGKSDFKKYINIATGLLLVLVTINPILKLISGEGGFDYYFNSISFDLQTTEVANEMKDAKEDQRVFILKKYKEEIRNQVKELLQQEDLSLIRCEVKIDEDETSETYARIQSMEVVASYCVAEDEPTSTIEKVQIESIVIGDLDHAKEKEHKEKEGYLSPMEIHIKTVLSDFYNMKEDNINISIQGG